MPVMLFVQGGHHRRSRSAAHRCQIILPDPPSTGSTGFSICMIWERQNSSASGIVNGLYSSNRVIDGDPFYVMFD